MTPTALAILITLQPAGPADLPRDWPGYASVDRAVRKVGLRDLRRGPLPARDLELRVWSGFSWGDLRGFVLARRAGLWRAASVLPTANARTPFAWRLAGVPGAGRRWNALWSELERLGLRTIPDEASQPEDGVQVMDGTKILVEVRSGAAYRAYYYDNPECHPTKPTSRAVAKMVRVIARELPASSL